MSDQSKKSPENHHSLEPLNTQDVFSKIHRWIAQVAVTVFLIYEFLKLLKHLRDAW
jgi:hypothetical protein